MEVTSVFPIEIWENILQNCDGRTLHAFYRINSIFKNIIDYLDKNFKIWKKCCFNEISKNELRDIFLVLYEGEPSWKLVFNIYLRWKNLENGKFDIVKMNGSYQTISDVKVSGRMILIADKNGFTVLNSNSRKYKKYKIGPVKHIELYEKPAEKSIFRHEILDCTLETDIHFFFQLSKNVHLKKYNQFERSIVRYGFDRHYVTFKHGVDSEERIIDVDLFYDKALIVTERKFEQISQSSFTLLHRKKYSWNGARCWFLWHAELVLCAKEETLDVFFEGKLKSLVFKSFPRVTAIFYFSNILLLGTVYGVLYMYRIDTDNIQRLNFQKYTMKIDVCYSSIVAIRIMEDFHTSIVVATENKIYHLLLQN